MSGESPETRQERREQKLKKRKERIPKHGRNIARVYVDAVLKSLEGFLDEQVVLIAGGRDKDNDFRPLKSMVEKKCRAVVLIGEAAGKIETAISGPLVIEHAGDMAEAVQKASSLAEGGDAVLLSPACASFDMFRDFEERGTKFKEAVKAL